MRKILKQDYFDLAVFLMDYHSGQWSRGYRLLCRLDANITSNCAAERRESEIYNYLESNYAGSV
jgi:hypothetical protein